MNLDRFVQRAVRLFSAAALAAFVLGCVAPTAWAQDEEPDRDYWVGRYEKLVSEVEGLRAKVDQLKLNYTRARTRNYPRGEALKELEADRDQAIEDLAEKEAELEEFPEEARRAGALPGWFRDLD